MRLGGWCLGADQFRQELLESVGAGASEPYRADARQETTEEKARRILREELEALGWNGAALAQYPKGDERRSTDKKFWFRTLMLFIPGPLWLALGFAPFYQARLAVQSFFRRRIMTGQIVPGDARRNARGMSIS
jgi:hypothetical protein